MSLTAAQLRAVRARGNVLVMAGAGSGKTSTLVERLLDTLLAEQPPPAVCDFLVVTFTEAAAAELRQRLRTRLTEEQARHPGDARWAEQLALFDTAHIGTIHSFCFQLIGQYFHQLELDPQLNVLPEAEARLLAAEILEAVIEEQFNTGAADALQQLLQVQAGGRDRVLRNLVLKVHRYSQSLPDPEAWFRCQLDVFENPAPEAWQAWLPAAFALWQELWAEPLARAAMHGNDLARQCLKLFDAQRTPASEWEDVSPPGPGVRQPSGTLANGADADPPPHKAAEGRRTPGRRRACGNLSREQIATIAGQVWEIGSNPPRGKKGAWVDPLKNFWTDARFLAALAVARATVAQVSKPAEAPNRESANAGEPLAEDWAWSRHHVLALLRLTRAFGQAYAAAKRERGELDFADLEQFALRLLWDFERNRPTAVAEEQRRKLRFVFVDEYQDINAAQDFIIQALSRAGAGANRFLVGDMKQSIYRFRLADPHIFRDYAARWREGRDGQTIALAENFRSREAILDFVNAVFRPLMQPEVGGLAYDDEAALRFGAPEERHALSRAGNATPRVELHLRVKQKTDAAETASDDELSELQDAEKEARLVAMRLKQLVADRHEIWDDQTKAFRAVQFSDMAVLLRAPSSKAEGYAKQFERVGVPLQVARSGFFDSIEIADLLNLLHLLDNPLQDLPVLAVLRSPLVGLTLDELAIIRLALPKGHFWTALARWNEIQSPGELSPNDRSSDSAEHRQPAFLNQGMRRPAEAPLREKVSTFLDRYHRWRRLARQGSLSRCLDAVLGETHYASWLLIQPRGVQRHANVERLLALAQQFDLFRRQGLFRFLRFIEAQQDAEAEPEVAQTAEEDAVRLMSIHQSKGLEFPVVVLGDLAKRFNDQDLRADLILDEQYGPCATIQAPSTGRKYPSLAHWLASRRQRRELLGEELRLLYVAMTRARDTLLLSGSVPAGWLEREAGELGLTEMLQGRSYLDWLWPWFGANGGLADHAPTAGQNPLFAWRLHTDDNLREPLESPSGFKVRQPSGAFSEVEPLAVPPERRRATALLSAGAANPATTLPGSGKQDEVTIHAEGLWARVEQLAAWQYAHLAATREPAKTSVTALRRRFAETEEATEAFPLPATSPETKQPASRRKRQLSAADVGTAHHHFLQHVALERTGSAAELEAEAKRLVQVGRLSAEESAVLDLEALAGFWNSTLGQRIREQAGFVRGELGFTARFSPDEFRRLVGAASCPELAEEIVVVQGVADLVVLRPEELWLLDFKTDAIPPAALAERAKNYEPQLRLYALALERIYRRPVTETWLHFLSLRQTIRIDPAKS